MIGSEEWEPRHHAPSRRRIGAGNAALPRFWLEGRYAIDNLCFGASWRRSAQRQPVSLSLGSGMGDAGWMPARPNAALRDCELVGDAHSPEYCKRKRRAGQPAFQVVWATAPAEPQARKKLPVYPSRPRTRFVGLARRKNEEERMRGTPPPAFGHLPQIRARTCGQTGAGPCGFGGGKPIGAPQPSRPRRSPVVAACAMSA